jgi:integrase
MTLVLTGLRASEYVALERHHLRPETFELEVPGSKTPGSAAVLPVEPAAWQWIDRAVPSPVGYRRRWHWWDCARRIEGLPDLRLHDLRHCTGQWAINEGVPESMVQVFLRHADPTMTRRYTVQQLRQEPVAAVARVIGVA